MFPFFQLFFLLFSALFWGEGGGKTCFFLILCLDMLLIAHTIVYICQRCCYLLHFLLQPQQGMPILSCTSDCVHTTVPYRRIYYPLKTSFPDKGKYTIVLQGNYLNSELMSICPALCKYLE